MKLLYVCGLMMILGGLSGCGGSNSANPLKDYSIKTEVPTGKVQEKQYYAPAPFTVDVEGQSDVNYVNFTERKEGSLAFRVRVLDRTQIQEYVLNPVSLPEGASFTRDSKDADLWILKWTPPRGIVAKTATPDQPQPAYTVFSIQLEAAVTKTTNPDYVGVVDRSHSYEIIVSANRVAPKISGINHLGDVSEGDAVPFSVLVEDPSNTPSAPTLTFGRYDMANNLENYKGDGSIYIMGHPSAPAVTKTSSGWLYNFVFSTQGRQIPLPLDRHGKPDTNASGLNVCFVMRVVNVYGVPAPEKSHCLKINYAIQGAVANFAPEAGSVDAGHWEVTPGKPSSLKFQINAPNHRGNVTVESATSLSTWAGSPKLLCQAVGGDSSSVSCELQWNVPCATKTGQRTLVLSALTEGQGRKKSSSITRDIVVNQTDLESCPAPHVKPQSQKQGDKK